MKNVFLFVLLLYTINASAQLTVSPLNGCSYQGEGVVDIIPVGCSDLFIDGGRDVTWNFSVSKKTDAQRVRFVFSGDTLFSLYDLECIRRFSLNDIGISLVSYEKPLIRFYYPESVPMLPDNISFGDSLSYVFSISGLYCDKYEISGKGVTTIKCDAYGKIIENGRDTINDMIRVHRVNKAFVTVKKPFIESFDYNDMTETEESYIWLDVHNGLPLYKYEICTLGDDTGLFFNNRKTVRFCFDREADSADDMCVIDSSYVKGENIVDKCIIDYDISNDLGKIVINYNLTEDAEVVVLLCDVSGIPYFSKRNKVLSDRTHTVTINTSGLRRGRYVIYIKVNGKVYSEKVNIS